HILLARYLLHAQPTTPQLAYRIAESILGRAVGCGSKSLEAESWFVVAQCCAACARSGSVVTVGEDLGLLWERGLRYIKKAEEGYEKIQDLQNLQKTAVLESIILANMGEAYIEKRDEAAGRALELEGTLRRNARRP
ncbi:hypothetical protein HDV05_007779, partial [Chytridiales sp. JEL 0842]